MNGNRIVAINEDSNQRIGIGPDCGGLERQSCFYFKTRNVRRRNCSLRIQTLVSNAAEVTSFLAGRQRHPDSRRARTRQIGRRRIGGGWAWRSPHRQLLGHLPRQLVRARRSARLAHRRRHVRLRIPRRTFLRRLGRLPGLDRRILQRIDSHYIATLRLSPTSGRVPVTAAAAIFT